MVGSTTQIPGCGSHNPTPLDFPSEASICLAVAFLPDHSRNFLSFPYRNSDHAVVSVSIDFPLTGCYLKLLDKLQKQTCRAVGPSFASFLEPLAHRQKVASLCLFYRHHLGRCSSELALHAYSRGWSSRFSNRLHDFSVTHPRCYKDVYVNSFFPCSARLQSFLPIKFFPSTYIYVVLGLELTDIF